MPTQLPIQQQRFLQQFFVESIRNNPSFPVVIAEGDSWFSFPGHANLLDHLDEITNRRMSLLRLEHSGDEVREILNVSGLASLRSLLDRHKPNVLLFSGGGNDIVGPELMDFVAPRTAPFSAQNALATQNLTTRFDEMRDAYARLIAARNEVAPNCLIVTHGYARAIPSGKKTHFLGFTAGPWLKPFLAVRNYTDPVEQRAIVDALMDRFNAMLDQFAATDPLFVKCDFRPAIQDNEWNDELHPTRQGFRDAAKVMLSVLRTRLPNKFPA